MSLKILFWTLLIVLSEVAKWLAAGQIVKLFGVKF